MPFDKKYSDGHSKRYAQTLLLLEKYVDKSNSLILDLGEENPMTVHMKSKGYRVENTPAGLDLDNNYSFLKEKKVDVVTAFEIFEHLVNPFEILKTFQSEMLIASVPLDLWFAKAYRNENNEWDRHFHEFEDWQFDWLLEKTGWEIIHREKWKVYDAKVGIRPLLRRLNPRIYAVVAKRK